MKPPGLDALQVSRIEVARPPDEIGRLPGEMDHVLTGSTADLDDISGSAGEMLGQRRPERFMVAVERRRIEPAIGLDPPAILAKFHHIFSQFKSPKKMTTR